MAADSLHHGQLQRNHRRDNNIVTLNRCNLPPAQLPAVGALGNLVAGRGGHGLILSD